MLRDLVSSANCDDSSSARNPINRLAENLESVSRAEDRGANDFAEAAPAAAASASSSASLPPHLQSRFSDLARHFDLSPQELETYHQTVQKQMERFSLDDRSTADTRDFAADFALRSQDRAASGAWADEMNSQLDPYAFEEGRLHDAADLLREFPYEFTPENPFLQTNTTAEDAVKLYENGRLADAVLVLEAIVQRNGNNSTAWRWLGTVHAENDEDKLAIASLLRAVQADPENLEALLDLGVSFTNELAQAYALQYLRLYLEKHPRYRHVATLPQPPIDDRMMPAFQAMHRRCVEMYQRAAQLDATDANLHLVLGVLFNLSREFDNAEAAFKTALSLDPNNYSLWNKLGATQANSSHLEGSKQAVFAYRRALELKPNYVRAWVNMGIGYANQQKHQIAARYYIKAIAQHPSADHIWVYLRSSLAALQRPDLVERAIMRDVTLLDEPSLK